MNLREYLESRKILLLDGAMGTQLDKRSLMSRGTINLDHPDAVQDIHKEYCRCGCNAIITNTLTMNRIYIETHNVEVDIRQVNTTGVKLAQEAAADGQFVLGDISSTGQMLEPYGTYKESQFYEAFVEQAEILAEAGVDGFIIETVFDLNEALCALRACKDKTNLPVIVSLSFKTEADGGRTIMGNTAADCAKELTDAGADALGANCGDLDPEEMALVVSLLKSATALPIAAQPNAGKPKLVNDKTIFEMGPEQFAAGVEKCIDAGATLVGGCCGTSPQHIQALADILNKRDK